MCQELPPPSWWLGQHGDVCGTLQDTTPPSSLVFQPKNQVAGTRIPQEGRDITTMQQSQHPTSAPFSLCESGAN